MYSRKLQPFAAVNGHDTDGVHVGRFGSHSAVGGILIQRFNAADAIKKTPSAEIAGGNLFTTNLQQMVDRDEFLLRAGIGGGQKWSQIVAALEEPSGEERPR